MSLFKVALAAGVALVVSAPSFADPIRQTTNDWHDAFRQLEDEDWPTPNRERRATGAPGRITGSKRSITTSTSPLTRTPRS